MFSKNMAEQKVNMIPSLVESVSVKHLKYQGKHFKPKILIVHVIIVI